MIVVVIKGSRCNWQKIWFCWKKIRDVTIYCSLCEIW